MGKEQELLEAARSGNLAVVERILSQRAKKTGPLASLRRGPGTNTHDQSGYTSLHHSALNGHRDVVALLLDHEASVNVVDNKGSTPLHLAAWAGNTDIVRLLLERGPSVPNVNHPNHERETALHFAAQYGHAEVAALLLAHGADPGFRNLKDESPLDLAAQYGRLDTVDLLLRAQPGLIRAQQGPSGTPRRHSPLHLASRNGHKQVVKRLLHAGFPVNHWTENGSALHEAATFGKVDVVRLLLDYGIDVNVRDSQKRTVVDILEDLNTNIAKQTCDIIKEHAALVTPDSGEGLGSAEDGSPRSITPPPPGFLSSTPPSHHQQLAALHHYAGRQQQQQHARRPSYGASELERTPPPLAKSRDSSLDATPANSRSPSLLYEVVTAHRNSTSTGDDSSSQLLLALSTSFHGGVQDYAGRHSANLHGSRSSDADTILGETPPPPAVNDQLLQDCAKRMSAEQSQNAYQTLPGRRTDRDQYVEPKTSPAWSSTGAYLPMSALQGKPIPPAKPPRRSVAGSSGTSPGSRPGLPSLTRHPSSASGYEYLCLANSGRRRASADGPPPLRRDSAEYVDMRPLRTPYENHEVILNHERLAESAFSTLYDEVASGRLNYATLGTRGHAMHVRSASDNTGAPSVKAVRDGAKEKDNGVRKPGTLDVGASRSKRATVQIPLSPTHYEQPPTPEFPPPSPGTAETGIHEKIRPLSRSEEGSEEEEEEDDDDDDDAFESFDEYTNWEYKSCKRSSKDIDTLTDDALLATLDANGAVVQVDLGGAQGNGHDDFKEGGLLSASAENIEAITEDNPFAGLCRGSTKCPQAAQPPQGAVGTHSNEQRRSLVKPPVGPKPAPPPRKHIRTPGAYENVHMEHGVPVTIQASSRPVASHDGVAASSTGGSPFDENAEWAEIADIMASFGSGIARESVFTREMEEQFTRTLTRAGKKEGKEALKKTQRFESVAEWLSSLGLSEYENLLLLSGYDDVRFMGGGIVEDQDLKDVGVSNAEHRRVMVSSAAECLPRVPIVGSDASLESWLSSIGLEGYVDRFRQNGFTDVERCRKIWEVELNTVLEITKLGHQKRVIASLGDRSSNRLLDLKDLDLGLSKLDIDLKELGIEDGDVSKATNNNHVGVKSLNASLDGDTELRMRPPTQLMSDPGLVPSSPRSYQVLGAGNALPSQYAAQWKHKPEVLIRSSCDYTAQYLGSTLVKELKGTESTRKSIQKLKTSTKTIAKIPSVLLSVSYTGVRFIDAYSKQQVCEHEIRNIHCACQDSDDLNHFAYITKEHQTNHHYCHVFCAETTDLATEIILTLGQAFEVAYQLALKEKTSSSSSLSVGRSSDDRNSSDQRRHSTPAAESHPLQPLNSQLVSNSDDILDRT